MLDWLFSTPLAAGSEAPDFTLPDQDGHEVTLSKLRGRNVVLIFYPRDETTVCRKQLCEFRDRSTITASQNVLVFGINPQHSASHKDFQDRHKLGFPLLVDSGQRVAALYKANGLVVKRTVYLIGKDGTIRFASRGKPLPEDVLQAAG
ncbi:MAG TPA: peroxiredoxin [Bryobacteraceae bacterium]|nr:peroxiredoxin [Bryobacteraceae bacterium]